MSKNTQQLLEILDLSIRFTGTGKALAVDHVNLKILRGQAIGIVGESGSGKSTLGFAIAGLLNRNEVEIEGSIFFENEDLLQIESEKFQRIRGSKIGYIFQDAASSLNPLLTIGNQLIQPLMANNGEKKDAARKIAQELLAMVEIPEPKKRFNQYPHELSGGMKQRVVIAAALARSPMLLIADEPTTALDVTVQAQIIDLLLRLKQSLSMSLVFISHDIGIVSRIADCIAVMRNGKILEYGPVRQVLQEPSEEYTKMLLANIPKLKYTTKSTTHSFWGDHD